MGLPIIGDIIDTIGGVVSELIPDKDLKRKLNNKLQLALLQLDLGQLEINKAEAQHASIFVAGWRPAIGWLGAIGLGYASIVKPLLDWVAAIWFPEVQVPAVDIALLSSVLFTLLGVGTMRTVEKVQGVARNKWVNPDK